jgi:hypothetical protein
MEKSIVLSLRIAATASEPMTALTTAHLVPSRGIEGDRYYYGTGSFSSGDLPGYEISLIEEDMYRELEIEALLMGNMKTLRRNIIVSGCSLAELIEQPFQIGTVLLRGVVPRRLRHLSRERLAQTRFNTGRGAQVLSEGSICVGDEVRLARSLVTLK